MTFSAPQGRSWHRFGRGGIRHGQAVHRDTAAEPGQGRLDLRGLARLHDVLGASGLVKVRGNIDGLAFRSSFTARGDCWHKLPVKADVRNAIGKRAGDDVTIRLEQRIEN